MTVSATLLNDRLELADALLAGRDVMLEPQDLPGRYGRVVAALDHVLAATHCEAVVGGGWAVWRHGYVGRVTQDIDVVLPADRLDEFLWVAGVNGFEVHAAPTGNWPKLTHKETGIEVDVLPEGGRPGTESRPAPTVIAHPNTMGAMANRLAYASLESVIELKLAAGRLRDEADVVELIRENRDRVGDVAAHLAKVHSDYANRFGELIKEASE